MPWGAIIGGVGAILGGVSSASQARSSNRTAKKQAKLQSEYDKKVYDFQLEEQERRYDYAVESLEIQKRNDEANLQFQEANLVQRYNYGMAVRKYEFNQAMRGYDQSVARAVQQQSYNELAEKAALVDQDRVLHEQLIDLAFDRTETLLDYQRAAAGLGLKQRQARAAAATEAQATAVSALKAQGAAAARGVSGRSAAKNVQGIVAETGARQAAIVDELMFNLENTSVDFTKLNRQFIIDQVGLDFSEESAKLSDTAARNKIKMQALQAAIQAEASIALKPEASPPLPKAFALPRAEYAEVFKPGKFPEPMERVAAQTNVFAAGLSGAISGAQTGYNIGSAIPTGGGGGGVTKYSDIPAGGLRGSAAGAGAGSNAYLGTGGRYGEFVPAKIMQGSSL